MFQELKNTASTGLYFHWPFCLAKCPYCDFNVHVETPDHDLWESSYLKAIDHYHTLLPDREIASIYFGGGTPSLMRPGTIEKILHRVRDKWSTAENMEVTLEANPTSVEIGKFTAFRAAGITRVSLGVQALNDKDLQFLGRKHSVAEALRAIDIARSVFDRYNFDLIYTRPGQTLEEWQKELQEALKYAGGHLSCYQLTIERGTPFYFDQAQEKFIMPGQDLAADFYLLTQNILEDAGLPAYEVSNHAAPDHRSLHNLIYWNYGDYIGIGPGAHGRLTIYGEKFATREHYLPSAWLEKVRDSGSGTHPFTSVPPRERFIEALMMGLRLRQGVSLEYIEKSSSFSAQDALDFSKIKTATEEGWLKFNDGVLKASREGWLRLNALIPYILKT